MAEPTNTDFIDNHPEVFGHSAEYYSVRNILLDPRGSLRVSPTSRWGFLIAVYTLSHNPGNFSELPKRPVVVEDLAWICSNCVLYNCTIGEGAIVSCGTVVRSRDVPPWTMVEGNPARIIARFDHDAQAWRYLETPEPIKPKSNRTEENA